MASCTIAQLDDRAAQPAAPGTGLLVAIEPTLPAVEQLARGVLAGATRLWLRPGDRLAQIADFLEQHPGYHSLHLLSHGAPGQLDFGDQQLDAAALQASAATLARWRATMAPNFALLLYGCNVAQGAGGRAFLETFHQLTGARLAASTGLVGQASLGGRWRLDAGDRQAARQLAFTPALQTAYPSLLVGTVADLIAAINAANADPVSPDTITLDTGVTFNLTSAAATDAFFGAIGLPAIIGNTTIIGNGATIQRDGGAPAFRFLLVGGLTATESANANVRIENVTFTGGFAGGIGGATDDGGAIFNAGGRLEIADSTITANRANDDGGGIASVGTIDRAAELIISNTAINNNISIGASLNDGGGGIDVDGNRDEGGQGSTLTINATSSLTGNSSTNGSGGGIRVRDGATLNLTDTSITNNTAPFGGGIAEVTNGGAPANMLMLDLSSQTIVDNDSGGGLDVESAASTTVNALPPNNGMAPMVTGSAIGTGNAGFTNIASLQATGESRIRVVRLDAAGGNFLSVVDDDTTTLPIDLGTVSTNSTVETFFRLENWGQAGLNLGAVTTAAPFTVATAPTSPVGSSMTTELSLSLDTTTEGTFLSAVEFTADDPTITDPFNFAIQATVSSTIVSPPTITDNIFVVGQSGNLKLQVDSAPTASIVNVRVSKLDAGNQATEIINLLSVLPDGSRPNGFSAAQQQDIFGSFAAGDRLGFELVKLDGSTVTFTSDQLQITEIGGGVFSFGFEIDGDSQFDDVVLTIQQTTAAPPLGSSSQTEGFEVIDLLGSGGVNASFTVYREAVFSNFVGFYRIDDASGSVGGIAPGQDGYAEAALEQRLNVGLFATNQGVSTFNASLEGNTLYAPFIIVESDPFTFLSNNPDNTPGIKQQAYFIFTAANPDGFDHIRLLGDNVFGFEDLPGGGDLDFNDIIVQANLG